MRAAGMVVLAMACFVPQVQAQYYDSNETVICESHDRQRDWCEADTRNGVELVEQLSRAACIEGETWGTGRRGIWVSGGCRAEFALGSERRRGGSNRPGRDEHRAVRDEVIICESVKDRRTYCPARIRRDAQLVQQLSRSSCQEGVTWGYDRGGVWVTRGCRGEFLIR
jgi:hypothetical protein